MTAAQSLHQRLGSLSLPPDVGAVADTKTLTSLDPARRILADLFTAAINAELAEAWTAAVANRFEPDGPVSSTLPVADVLELEPTRPHMQARQSGFPLLAIYRNGTGQYEQHTLGETRLRQPWTIDWVLGPADIAQKFQLGDAAVAVSKIIALVVEKRAHPAYQSGALQFSIDGNASGITSIRMVRHVGPGVARFADDESSSYYAITIEIETLEVAGVSGNEEDAAGVFDGADYDVAIGGSEGTIRGLVFANTDPPLQRS